MSFVAVLPSIYPLWTDRCIDSMSPSFRQSLILIDNTVDNIGVAASWNLGIDRMEELGTDWLVIVSASMRFGAPGGMDFIAELESTTALAVEAGHGIGWHLVAFPRSTIERVGRFDPVFPAYYEDLDYGRRISLAFDLDSPPWWSKVSVDVAMAGFSHGIDLGGVRVDNHYLEARWIDKWGGTKGAEKFALPYDGQPITYIGEPPA